VLLTSPPLLPTPPKLLLGRYPGADFGNCGGSPAGGGGLYEGLLTGEEGLLGGDTRAPFGAIVMGLPMPTIGIGGGDTL
jgi:hypothetical protein